METKELILTAGVIILLVVMIGYYSKCSHKLKKLLFGSLSGVAVLYPASLIIGAMGYGLTMNLFTVSVSVLLGIPGVALLIVTSCL